MIREFKVFANGITLDIKIEISGEATDKVVDTMI